MTAPSHFAGIILYSVTIRLERLGLGPESIAIPLPLQYAAFGILVASYARRMSSPKMNLLVILATNIQILSGRLSIVSVRKTFFKMGKATLGTDFNV
jgi:hypothetical protein